MTDKFWTEARTAMLKKMNSEGKYLSEIAAVLGTTRGAISGKVMRLGLNTNGKFKPPKPLGSRTRAQTSINAQAVNAARNIALRPSLRANDPGVKRLEPAPPVNCLHIGIMQLDENTCRWPMGSPGEAGFSFCGLPPLAPSRYCPFHEIKSRKC